MIKVAIIGAGGIVTSHLEAFKQVEGMQATAIADINEVRVTQMANEYGLAPYTDYKVMLSEQKPDAVIITLPHFLHKPAAVACAELGCHIYLEKPMAMDEAECDEIMAAAERNGVQLMVGHTQHYLPSNRKAKGIIRGGSLGKLIMINDQRHSFYFPETRPGWFLEKAKSGGGIMMNLGSHSLDRIQWLTDSRFTRIKGSITFHADRGDVEGSGLIYGQTSIGVPAVICQSGYKGAQTNMAELMFTGGMLKIDAGGKVEISRGGAYEEVPVEDQTSPFLLQLEDFRKQIETGEQPYCSGEYAKSVIAAVQAVYRSHELGAEVDVMTVGNTAG
ncbi:Gfo/Idh/MocA family protein [Paenibacillus sp. MBLB4367]|uniref:Gfo/Idh/MocA family protein n=1 Tax=Paenibacillus sp. MBLB4367 TaxID=3384767 RepID=UPI0039083B2A